MTDDQDDMGSLNTYPYGEDRGVAAIV